MNCIFWIDSNPDSLQSLFATLEMRKPPYFAVLFPRELEAKMRRLEREYTEMHHRDTSEENIVETRFELVGREIRVQTVFMKRKR